MNTLTKLTVLNDVIKDCKRDINNVRPYYPLIHLLEIMKDVMNVELQEENLSFKMEVETNCFNLIDEGF